MQKLSGMFTLSNYFVSFLYLITGYRLLQDILLISYIKKSIRKEKCRAEALKYTKRSDFAKKSPNLYDYAYKSNILDEICSHMIQTSITEINRNLQKQLKL